jgi:glycosyltransferase involved in cell wall biosynthesis
MIAPIRTWDDTSLDWESTEDLPREIATRLLPPPQGTALKGDNSSLPLALAPIRNGAAKHASGPKVLAMFCFEEWEGALGQYVGQVAAALGRRQRPVHLFTRSEHPQPIPGVEIHAVGNCEAGNLLAQVKEFTRRSGNAFLQRFPNGADVTLMGFEWSTVEVLSLLRGIKNADTILSLHSLERQRSDMASVLSQEIEAVELAGLREAKTIWIHDPAASEMVNYWARECLGRIVAARQAFPFGNFDTGIDPGEVKARYQVGPTDPTILFIGDLHERYGGDLLVKAMPPILKNHPQARLIMVGDGALLWPLRVYCRYLFLEHAVRLAGHLDGKPLYELIQAADMVVVPSREPTPWWPIQAAWAAGKPVAASHEAARGLLDHDQDCILFYPSENSCVWGIERFLFDPQAVRQTAQKGYQKLEQRFGWNGVAAQVEEMLAVGEPVN